MKQRLLTLFLSCGILAAQAQVDPEYKKIATERAEKIVAEVKPSLETDKKKVVSDLVADQYNALHAIHAERDRQLEQEGGNRDRIVAYADSVVAVRHQKYVTELQKLITADQVEAIKNGMTYYTVPKTYNNYLLMLPFATDEELVIIRDNLTEAREHAMDGGSAKEKHAWFNKYKGRIANALANRGYNLKEEGERWAERRNVNSSATYITESNRVIEKLGLSDKWQTEQVRNLLAFQYQKMDEIYAAKQLQTVEMEQASLNELEKEKRAVQIWEESKGALDKQRDKLFEKLNLLLTDAQIELVKNEMTYSGFQKELSRFEELLPTLTDEHKKVVIGHLEEARENALNVLTGRERNQWFAKYRGRANNYLSKQGYDLRKATEELERRRKGEE